MDLRKLGNGRFCRKCKTYLYPREAEIRITKREFDDDRYTKKEKTLAVYHVKCYKENIK